MECSTGFVVLSAQIGHPDFSSAIHTPSIFASCLTRPTSLPYAKGSSLHEPVSQGQYWPRRTDSSVADGFGLPALLRGWWFAFLRHRFTWRLDTQRPCDTPMAGSDSADQPKARVWPAVPLSLTARVFRLLAFGTTKQNRLSRSRDLGCGHQAR
jgi:hypothetical protein